MIINNLHLINFKRFKDTKIDFEKGITGIIGTNGAGKSSIVDAIFFALYGVSGGIATEFIVSSFADGAKCEITMGFAVGLEKYQIIRTFKKGKAIQHDATLTHTLGSTSMVELRATGVSQVEAEIRKILGMGPVDFRNTVYAAQKDLMTLLDLTPGKRREWFLRALGIDYLNTGSQKILKEQVDLKEKEAMMLQGELAALSKQDPMELDQTRKNLAGLKEEICILQETKKKCDGEQEALSVTLQGYNIRSAKHEQLVAKETDLRNDISTLSTRIDILTNQITSSDIDVNELSRLDQDIKEIPTTRTELETHQSKQVKTDAIVIECKNIASEISALGNKTANIHSVLDKLDSNEIELGVLYKNIRLVLSIPDDVIDIEEAVKNLQADNRVSYASISTAQAALAKEQSKLLSDLKVIKDAGSNCICPLCRRLLQENDIAEVLKDYERRLDVIAIEYEKNHNTTVQLETENKILLQQISVLTSAQKLKIGLQTREFHAKDLAGAIDRINAIGARNAELILQREEMGYDNVAHLTCQQHLVDLEDSRTRHSELTKKSAQQAGIKAQVAELSDQVCSKTVALAEVKMAIDTNTVDAPEGLKLTNAITELNTTLKTIVQKLTLSIERETVTTRNITVLEIAMRRISDLQIKSLSLADEIETLKLTRIAIADYVVYIMQVVRSRIESEVGSIISEITGGKYDRVLLDEDFNLLVRENDKEYTVDRFSGGEQDDIAVALRIALSRYLAELHNVHESTLLIFDEIFGSQDEERRANLLTALRSQESRFPQIILISHIAEIQGEFENTLIVQGAGPISTVKVGA